MAADTALARLLVHHVDLVVRSLVDVRRRRWWRLLARERQFGVLIVDVPFAPTREQHAAELVDELRQVLVRLQQLSSLGAHVLELRREINDARSQLHRVVAKVCVRRRHSVYLNGTSTSEIQPVLEYQRLRFTPRRSRPPSNAARSTAVISICLLSLSAGTGQANVPFSRRLCSNQKPERSQYRILIRSR